MSFLALTLLAATAVPITLEGAGMSVRSEGGESHTCGGERCTFDLAPGKYVFTAPDLEETFVVDGPVTARHRPGSPTLRTAGGVMLGGGALVTILGVYVGLEICKQTYHPETGVTDRPCDDPARRRLQYGFLGAAGVGFTASVIGGFLFFGAGPSITFDAPVHERPGGWSTVAIVPVPGGLGLAAQGMF